MTFGVFEWYNSDVARAIGRFREDDLAAEEEEEKEVATCGGSRLEAQIGVKMCKGKGVQYERRTRQMHIQSIMTTDYKVVNFLNFSPITTYMDFATYPSPTPKQIIAPCLVPRTQGVKGVPRDQCFQTQRCSPIFYCAQWGPQWTD